MLLNINARRRFCPSCSDDALTGFQAAVPAAAQAIWTSRALLLRSVAAALSASPPPRSPIVRTSRAVFNDHVRIGFAISGGNPGVPDAVSATPAASLSAVRPTTLESET